MGDQLSDSNTKPSPSRQGKGSKQRQRDNFNRKKNREFDQKLADEMAAKYGLNDYPTVQQIPVRVSKPAEIVPITINTVPRYVEQIWVKMQSLGLRNFAQYDTQAYKLNFIKVLLLICEAKVSYGQRNGSPKLPFNRATSLLTFTDDQLTRLLRIAKSLPKPLAAYVDNLGYVSDQGQTVFAVKANLTACPPASGAFNYFPSDLRPLLQALRAGVVDDLEPFRQLLDPLGATFEVVDGRNRMTEASYTALQYPEGWISGVMEEMFCSVIACFNLRKGFNSLCNIEHGMGQKSQLVRFVAYGEQIVTYYSNSDVPPYYQLLAGAFGFGQEHEVLQKSRFVSDEEHCLISGQVDVMAIRHEVIWYETPE